MINLKPPLEPTQNPDDSKPFKANIELFYEKGEYALTIAPDDNHQFWTKTSWDGKLGRMEAFKHYYFEKLLCYKRYGITHQLYIELTEPTNTEFKSKRGPRLHLHGIIKFHSHKAVKYFLLRFMPDLCDGGILCVKKMDNKAEWLKYCKKQQKIIKENPLTNMVTDSEEDTDDDE